MGTTTVILILGTIFSYIFDTSVACNGYRMRVNHINNCNSNSVIKLDHLNLTLDKDCNIIPSGCVIITKPFETAQVHYIFNKPPLPTIQGDVDLCEEMASNTDKALNDVLVKLQLPTKCPANARKSCADASQRINISKFKNRLGVFAGTMSVKTEVTHDSGTTCTDVNLTLEKIQQG